MKSLGVLVGKVLSLVLGVAVGLATAFMLLFPMIDLFMCDTVWEQGCEPHHELRLLGSLAASGLSGLFAGWGAADLFNRLVTKLLRQ